jgi:hypothetical protein
LTVDPTSFAYDDEICVTFESASARERSFSAKISLRARTQTAKIKTAAARMGPHWSAVESGLRN